MSSKFCVGNAGQSGAIKLSDAAVEKEVKRLLAYCTTVNILY